MISVNIIIELICLVIAFICLRTDKVSPWRYQVIYLAIVCITEFTGRYLIKVLHHTTNSWVYNLLIIAEALFILSIFYYILQAYRKGKPVFYGGLILFFVWFFICFFCCGFFFFFDFFFY